MEQYIWPPLDEKIDALIEIMKERGFTSEDVAAELHIRDLRDRTAGLREFSTADLDAVQQKWNGWDSHVIPKVRELTDRRPFVILTEKDMSVRVGSHVPGSLIAWCRDFNSYPPAVVRAASEDGRYGALLSWEYTPKYYTGDVSIRNQAERIDDLNNRAARVATDPDIIGCVVYLQRGVTDNDNDILSIFVPQTTPPPRIAAILKGIRRHAYRDQDSIMDLAQWAVTATCNDITSCMYDLELDVLGRYSEYAGTLDCEEKKALLNAVSAQRAVAHATMDHSDGHICILLHEEFCPRLLRQPSVRTLRDQMEAVTYKDIHLIHDEYENDPTVIDLDPEKLSPEERFAWGDVLNASVKRVYEGTYGMQMEISGVSVERLDAFSDLMASPPDLRLGNEGGIDHGPSMCDL